MLPGAPMVSTGNNKNRYASGFDNPKVKEGMFESINQGNTENLNNSGK